MTGNHHGILFNHWMLHTNWMVYVHRIDLLADVYPLAGAYSYTSMNRSLNRITYYYNYAAKDDLLI